LKIAGSIIGVFLLIVAILNVLVDPFFVFGTAWDGPLSAYKPDIASRTAKAELLRRHRFPTLLLGSSRVEVGVAPDSPAFEGDKVFNAALRGANFYETYHEFRYAVETIPLERVFLFVDFYQFTSTETASRDFTKCRFAPHLDFSEYYLEYLFSWRAAESSFNVLTRYIRKKPAEYSALGHRCVVDMKHTTRPTRELFAAVSRGFIKTLATYRYSQDRLDLFRDVVRTCREKGIELTVVIPPVHAVQLETYEVSGLWETFLNWKRDLLAVLEAEGNGHVPLWDFTGYSEWTTEEVPDDDSIDGMKWYYESSHFKSALGDLMLARILGRPDASEAFGVLLTPDDIDEVIRKQSTDQMHWAESHPDIVRMLQDTTEAFSDRFAK